MLASDVLAWVIDEDFVGLLCIVGCVLKTWSACGKVVDVGQVSSS
jgi:hypothetical protein